MRILDSFPLRVRLTLIYGVWMALLLPALGWGLFTLVKRNLMQSVDAALSASAQAMIDSRASMNDSVMDELLSRLLGERHINTMARVVDLSGKVRTHGQHGNISLPMTSFASQRAEQGFSTFETFERKGKSPFRLLTVPLVFDGRFSGDVIQVGASLETTESALSEIGAVLWFAFPVGLIFSLGVSYYLTGGSLSPVVAIQTAASNLSATDLSTRLPLPKADDELRGLTRTFNGMLDRLQDTFGRLRRFSSDVSHELRTPLAAIRGEAELALRRTRSQEEYQETLKTIQRESVHMTRIVEDLLLLARAESQSVAYSPEFIESQDFFEKVSLAAKSFFQERNILLVVDNQIATQLYCAPGYLTQALLNILTNAAKHSSSNQSVTLKAISSKSWHHISITDTGEGIPADQVDKIFDPFYRVDSARNRKVGGAGIGLSLAMALVRLHQGDIKVTSEPTKGSTFTISIPANPAVNSKLLMEQKVKN
ncbi:MAG: ATP-binding protein [Proteobacteria bacterium]|nr:ATP-binding protein [Pseudomonadota bacterium]